MAQRLFGALTGCFCTGNIDLLNALGGISEDHNLCRRDLNEPAEYGDRLLVVSFFDA